MDFKRSPKVEALFDELRALNLPDGKYAVFGSGPMGIRGLHEINDVDVIVTPDLFAELEARYGAEDHEHGIRRVQVGNVEILDGWYPSIAPIEDLIAAAEEIEGMKFVRLEDVLRWKRLRGKPKDAAHIDVIEQYLGSRRQ